MGCDIHTTAQKRNGNGEWEEIAFSPFSWRAYGMFGFLADVRNYSAVPPIAEQRGLPHDYGTEAKRLSLTHWESGYHSWTWLSFEELIKFNYDQVFEDRRYIAQTGPNSWDGGATCEPGDGHTISYREFLGADFFADLQSLEDVGADRLVFWFDS